MGHRLNLSHLTEEECELILKVIQKDFGLRQLEKDRLALIEAKVKEEDARLNILATREDFNDKYCMICFKKFLFFFIPKTRCNMCKHYYCKDCISYDIRLNADICNSCQKYHAFLLQSNSWFYKRLSNKFKRFGSAKVIRSLYKRKTESDAESDSGYHPSVNGSVVHSESNARRSRPNLSKVFELDETRDNLQKNENDEDEPLQTLSFYKQKLEAIKRQLRKAYLESTGTQQNSQKSIYEDALNKQNFNISLLLSAMVNDMTSNLNESATKDQNASKEIISKYVLEQCIDHIYESLSNEIDSFHPFGIDPEDLTLRGYIQKLSEAILSKIDIDLKSSDGEIFQQEVEVEEKVQKEPLKSSNRAGITQVQKELSDSELEELHVTTDSISDIDGREWQARHSADSMSMSSPMKQKPPNRIDYDESEYDVDENSIFAFASRKKGTLVLPELESHSSLQQSDIDLELTSQKDYSSDEDPWTLSANGPAAVMSNRIPIAPYDNYGKKKCGPTETEGDLKMFLPKRHSIEGPMIDNMNVYELSDLSDTSMDSPFEEVRNYKASSLREEVPDKEKANQHPSENDSKDSVHDSNQPLIPWFEMVPQDIHVLCGEEFTCSCKPNGAKPVDVFWYRDGKELIQIGSDERHNLLNQGVLHWLIVSNSQTSDSGMYLCVAINEHGTCQHTFTITVIERNEFHERSVDTNRRKNLGMNRLANTNQDKPELETGLPPTAIVTVDAEDGKYTAIRASDVNTGQKWRQGNSANVTSHVPAMSNKKAQNILHFQEDDYQNSKKYEHTFYNEQDNDNSHYSSQKRQNSDLSERTKRSSTTNTTGRNCRDSYSANETDKYTEREITKDMPHDSNVLADISLQKTGENNLPRRFHTMASYEGEVLSKTNSHPLLAASRSDNLKTTSGRFDFLEDAKSPGSQNRDSIDAQYPRVLDAGLPVIDYKRYSRDYEVRNKDNSSAITNEQSKAIERKISNDTNRLTRRTDSSSTIDSDVFETGRSSTTGSTTQTTIQSSAKSDFDDIALPSVKQLRMKFSAPPDTSAAEALRRKKNRLESKAYQDAELRLKSTERDAPPFPSSFLPVSVVPLQPAPVNSRSASQSSVAKDNLPSQSRPETKFQKEVIIRQPTANKSQSDEIDEELELSESDPSNGSSIAGRMVIRPFSQRTDSTDTETRTKYHNK